MKKTTLFVAFIVCTFVTLAQQYKRKTPEEKAKFYTQQMMEEIKLDTSQVEKIYQINLTVSKQFDSMYATKPDKDVARKGAYIIYKGRDAALKLVLTTEQFLRFDDIEREKREKRQKEKAEQEKLNAGNEKK